MRATIAELEARHEQLKRQLTPLEDSYASTREVIRKADARRAQDGDTRKWNRVLDNLERSLDQLRVRVRSTRDQLQTVEQELRRARSDQQGIALESDSVAPAPLPREIQNDLNIEPGSLESLVKASVALENFATVGAADPDRAMLLEAEIELANQTGSVVPAPESGERRSQLALRSAIGKIQGNRIADMTPEELSLTVHCHNLLSRRVNPSLGDQRLVRLLGAAIRVLQRKQGQTKR